MNLAVHFINATVQIYSKLYAFTVHDMFLLLFIYLCEKRGTQMRLGLGGEQVGVGWGTSVIGGQFGRCSYEHFLNAVCFSLL